MITVRLRFAEKSFQYKEQLTMFSIIAQKARRLDHGNLDETEAKQLCQQLEELFETTKGRGLEPDNEYFSKAKNIIKGMNTFPFGLTKDNV